MVNAGQSGDTSRGGKARLNWVLRSKPNILVLALGSNDGLRGIPVKETQQNLSYIIETAQNKGITVVLVQNKLPENYGKRFISQFSNLFKELAKKYSLLLTPFLLDGVALKDNMTLEDRIHPNSQGTDKMLENTWKTLEKAIIQSEEKSIKIKK